MITTYEEAVSYLEAHIGRGVRPGLERISGLMEMMGRPDQAYPIIHVAGTNGKTSTARMATMLLVAHGLTTGTFTSPHLERVEERLGLNGIAATPEQFVRAVGDVAAFADIYEEREAELSYFELTAAMAFAFFADEAADAAVIEVGLGGRLDATNVCAGAVSVLTEIGLDHREYLGDTIEAITAEKLGIVEPGSSLVTGDLIEAAWPVVEAVCRERDVTEIRFGRDFHLEDVSKALDGWRLGVAGLHEAYPDIHLPIHGRHQTVNLAVAVAAVEAITDRALDPEAVVDAASVMTSPGRMEPVAVDPFVLLDGAHNPDGFEVLGAALREEFPTTTWVLVTASMQDKDIESMYPHLAGLIEHVAVTQVESSHALDATDLASRMRPLIGADTEISATPRIALERARDVAGSDGNILVAGSLYLVGAVRSIILGDGEIHANER